MASAVKDWIKPDETAKEMLTRIFTVRPFLILPPPLHKLPLRAGNVVEIVGPSSSAKTHILMQAAISCILPKEWKGVPYGGMERLAAFVDLDCRFDIFRFTHLLKHRIVEARTNDKKIQTECDQELFAACMRRFLYIRCYDSFELLATLKTMNYQLQKEKEIHGVAVQLLIFDSIGAFYWMDRSLPALSLGGKNRKHFSLQSVTENVVQEIQKLLLVHPMLVLASKTASLGEKYSANESTRSLDHRLSNRWPSADALDLKNVRNAPHSLYREYMPLVWQSYVTHRVHVRPSDDKHQNQSIYLTKWLLPSTISPDSFTVNDTFQFKSDPFLAISYAILNLNSTIHLKKKKMVTRSSKAFAAATATAAAASSRIFFFLFLLFSIAPLSAQKLPEQFADAIEKGKVLELDQSNFDNAISTFDYIFVDFYAPWCGHCKRLAPELEKAAPVLAGLKQPIVVAKIDADKYRSLANKHDIDGYPTLKIFMHGVPTEYFGPRKADLLVGFLKKFVAPDVAVLSSDSAIREFVEAADTSFPIFIGFGVDESKIKNLAIKYKKKAWFSIAKDFSDEIMSFYDFDKVPALVALHPNYNEQSIFYGPFEETFLEDYITQSLLPMVLPINQESLKLLKDDKRKIVLTIVNNELDDKSKELFKLLKAAASANRDLIFVYVGFQQFEVFAESFDVNKKTQFPKMVVWDGDEEYFSVIGSESITEVDQGSQITRFLEGYREGSVIQKNINGPSFMGFIKSLMGTRSILIIIFLVGVFILILTIGKEEPLRVGTKDQLDQHSSSTSTPPPDAHRTGDKED